MLAMCVRDGDGGLRVVSHGDLRLVSPVVPHVLMCRVLILHLEHGGSSAVRRRVNVGRSDRGSRPVLVKVVLFIFGQSRLEVFWPLRMLVKLIGLRLLVR